MDASFLKWINHAGFFCEEKGKAVYIDPFMVKDTSRKADVVFVTHPHFDHMHMETLKQISKPETLFVAPEFGTEKLKFEHVVKVKPFEEKEVLGIKFKTVPAYNTKQERLKNHPKANGWVGYVMELNGVSVYHAGDTDFVEEMKGLAPDIALLPMGGTYTMDVNEAIEAAKAINAKLTIPMHYKVLLGKEGAEKAEQKFTQEIENSEILKEIQEPDYSFNR